MVSSWPSQQVLTSVGSGISWILKPGPQVKQLSAKLGKNTQLESQRYTVFHWLWDGIQLQDRPFFFIYLSEIQMLLIKMWHAVILSHRLRTEEFKTCILEIVKCGSAEFSSFEVGLWLCFWSPNFTISEKPSKCSSNIFFRICFLPQNQTKCLSEMLHFQAGLVALEPPSGLEIDIKHGILRA